MIAVIKTGGKQYKVKKGDKIKVEKLDVEVGRQVVFGDVLLAADQEKELNPHTKNSGVDSKTPHEYIGVGVKIGKPHIKGAEVLGKVVKQARAKKVIVFKYKPKKRYHKKRGHRQMYTEVEITSIKV